MEVPPGSRIPRVAGRAGATIILSVLHQPSNVSGGLELERRLGGTTAGIESTFGIRDRVLQRFYDLPHIGLVELIGSAVGEIADLPDRGKGGLHPALG